MAQRDCTLGVILVELNGSDKNVVKRVIGDKVHVSLSNTCGRAAVDQMRISFHFFPEESEGKEHPSSPDKTLYPDLTTVNTVRKVSLWMKRTVDVVGSFLALVILSPLFLAISILIKLTSKGPILFKQERMGDRPPRTSPPSKLDLGPLEVHSREQNRVLETWGVWPPAPAADRPRRCEAVSGCTPFATSRLAPLLPTTCRRSLR